MKIIADKFHPPYCIIGMAKSGQSALNLLLASGIPRNQISTFDDVPGRADFAEPTEMLRFGIRTAIVAPGYPLSKGWIQKLEQQGTQIIGEIDLASCFFTTEKIIGITGSVGKSTTVGLIGSALYQLDRQCFVGGNFGTPVSEYALMVFKNPSMRAKYLVLELSSFQLENSKHLSLDVSAITYFSGNHLERYKSIQDYFQTKWSIVQQTKGACFLNSHSHDLVAWSEKHPDPRCILISTERIFAIHPELLKNNLVGKHNLENIALAQSVVHSLTDDPQATRGLIEFKGLPHRLELVKETNNFICINDSKATAIESVLTAIFSARESYPHHAVYVLIGGKDKNLPWENLSSAKDVENIRFHFFGECGGLAHSKSKLSGLCSPSLAQALDDFKATHQPNQKIILLLSPGGSSFDEFKGFEDRGNFFKNYCNNNF